MNNPRHHERAPLPSQLMNVPTLPTRQGDKAHIRSFSPDPTSYSPSFAPPSPIETTAIVPFSQAAESPITTVVTEATEAKKSGFSIGDIKQVIDRMGGIDGIVETMGKVQKVMNSVSQIAPVAKLLMGTLLPGKKKDEEEEEEIEYTPKRRRRRRRTTGNNRTPSFGKQRQRTNRPTRRR
ncbi:hypothetical protein ABE142_16635 [Paenibacillus alvei]|uniref:hypothetical protein n=1 Tax=Paenibacillus alvei TaxID=44250 RepID=UPI003D2E7664